ncbi:MAG: tyrosine-type recombinase/integrase [Parvularculaceae bacterium]
MKPITVNGELNILNLVFNWAVKQRHLLTAPKCERVPQAPAKTIVPTPEEVVRIITHLPDYLKPLIRFLAETGCRKGEAINLTWECVDEEAGFVDIESREGWTPKTQQSERRIPLSDGLLEVIRNLPRKGAYVFPGDHPDKPIGEFRKTGVNAVAAAEIKRRGRPVHIQVKSLRKAHATWQAERGVAESVLQGLMGHAKGSRITRQFYVQVTDEAKRAAVIELPGRAAPVPAITAGDHLNSRKEIKA